MAKRRKKTLREVQLALFYNDKGRRVGQTHPRAKVGDDMVNHIFELHDDGHGTRRISLITGVPRSTICDMLSCRTRSQVIEKIEVITVEVEDEGDD